ncbi:hypothetical protein GCM10028791_21220 [Echinicola sediminis]
MNNSKTSCFSFVLAVFALASCGKGADKQRETGPTAKLELEVVDSLVIDELEPLYMDDHMAELGYFMLRNSKTRQPLLVDEKGTVIQEFDILHDGPDGIGNYGVGYRLLNDTAWVAQNLMKGYFVFDYQGRRLKKLPALFEDIFSITINPSRTGFHPYVKNGKAYILGEEINMFDHKAVSPEELGADFYDSAKTIFNLELASSKSERLVTYPAEWEPRRAGRYVGKAFPLAAINRKNKEMAILPTVGNQLFVYDYSGDTPVLKDSIKLEHRFRPEKAPDADLSAERWLEDYPLFTDLNVLGEGYLISFSTRIPKEVLRELRAKSEQYYNLPEFKAASEQYRKAYHIVVNKGKQEGVIDQLPVHGGLDFSDEEGFLYINDNMNPEIEREYNVFYKVKIKN